MGYTPLPWVGVGAGGTLGMTRRWRYIWTHTKVGKHMKACTERTDQSGYLYRHMYNKLRITHMTLHAHTHAETTLPHGDPEKLTQASTPRQNTYPWTIMNKPRSAIQTCDLKL